MRKFYEKYRYFILYVMNGAIATAVDMGIFFLLSDAAGLHYLPSNIISVFFGILTSFELNSRFNFKKRNLRFKRFVSFSIVCLLGMGLGSLLLTAFYVWMGIPKFFAKALSVMIAGVFQYFFNKNITFKN